MSSGTAGAVAANRSMLGFGHAIFATFHVAVLYFGVLFLLITIPVHLVYVAVALAKQDSNVRRPDTNVPRTECDELIPNSPTNISEPSRCKLLPQALN